MLDQLQKMFSYLELSEKNTYLTDTFCFSYKELDGKGTNVMEQKDANEFLGGFLDSLQTQTKNTTRKYLVDDTFNFQTCIQQICPNCHVVKNKIEQSLSLGLPVKNFNSIDESLGQLVYGEEISGYRCDYCGETVDLKKQTMIASTPNVLVIHLERIVYNVESNRNEKVNSYCSFPTNLDLKPYSFHEVMRQKGLLKTRNEEREEEAAAEAIADPKTRETKLTQLREAKQPD